MKSIREIIQKIILKSKLKLNPEKFSSPISDYFGRSQIRSAHALLIYKTMPFHLHTSNPAFNFHQSMIQSRIIAETLDELGYCVDVIDHSKKPIPLREKYDLVISHNSKTIPQLACFANACRIYLASGTEHRCHNLRQKERLAAFEKRMGTHRIELNWDEEEMPWADHAAAIFCFGNEAVAATWRERFSCPVLPFENTALSSLPKLEREQEAAKSHFLFLGSRQQLAKGLDLLLEAFATNKRLHLHICGHFLKDRSFCNAYQNVISKSENIHSHGWVDVTSASFHRIASKCAFTISATCAEGSPGSITNAMRLGLIPILSPEAGLDGGNGILILDDLTVPGIQRMIRACSSKPVEELEQLSRLAVNRAISDFSEATFRSRWIEMLSSVLASMKTPSV